MENIFAVIFEGFIAAIAVTFPTKEEFLQHNYTSAHIISAIIAAIGFFCWCAYRVRLYLRTPDSEKQAWKIIFWVVLFCCMQYVLSPATSVLFSLIIGTVILLSFLSIQGFLMYITVYIYLNERRKGVDCLGWAVFSGGLALIMLIFLFLIMDISLYQVLSLKYYN